MEVLDVNTGKKVYFDDKLFGPNLVGVGETEAAPLGKFIGVVDL